MKLRVGASAGVRGHAAGRAILKAGVGLLLAFVSCCSAAVTRPNIVFILADDLGWRDLGCYGSKFHKTPNIDSLAERGMMFTQAYAANPLCSPTRASILTGLYPARIGITAPVGHVPEIKLQASIAARGPVTQKCLVANSATRLDTNYLTLAEVLKEAGYATGHFGKWHLGAVPYSPLQQGFDVDVPNHPGPGPAGSYVAPWKFAPALKFTGAAGEHIEDRMAHEAVKFIRANKERPFFLNYWAFSVHAPYDAKKSLIEKYRTAMDTNAPQRNPLYAAMVQSLDDAVGTLVRTLAEEKLLDRTMIVFFSDNGGVNWQALRREGRGGPDDLAKPFAEIPPTSNFPLRGGKASVYEGGVREPCFIVWPGVIKPATRSAAMIQSIDFLPTLAEVASAKPSVAQRIDGRSFLPVLRGETATHRETIFTYFPHNTAASAQLPACAVRRGPWKLIRYFHDGPRQEHRYELFNLDDDVGETKDLAPAEPARVKELDALITLFLKDTAAVVPGANPAWRADAKAGEVSENAEAARDPMQGWKARGCTAQANDGILTLTGTSAEPFLGFAVGRLEGSAKVRFRILASGGGGGRLDWLANPGAAPAEIRSRRFNVKGGAWEEITSELPADAGRSGIMRLYVPAQSGAVKLDWIELGSGEKKRRWEFDQK